MTDPQTLPPLPLPPGISENYVHCPSTGLTIHTLESGYTPQRDRPLLLLIHGFPELALSWRKIMPALADAGYYVVAYDQRGYGRTTGWDTSPYATVDLSQFSQTSIVKDAVALVSALGYTKVKCVIGHDFGAVTASRCALMRPDMFTSLVMMSHPFTPPTPLPFNTAHASNLPASPPQIDFQLALSSLSPPRKHYKWYNSTPAAAHDWSSPPQGLHAFLRGYFHVKSGAWPHNTPFPLASWTADGLAQLPHYYIMPLHLSMPATIAALTSTSPPNAPWLSDADLALYVAEFSRTGFQGGLNHYRVFTTPSLLTDMDLFAGRKIEGPSTFISGERDWGNYQTPGALEGLQESCGDFRGTRMVEGAGHWVQQEAPERVVEEVLGFLGGLDL